MTAQPMTEPRALQELNPAEALDLLASVSYGRVVFTLRALPAIRPVNHVIDDGEIVIRTRRLAGISTALADHADDLLDQEPDLVVAYEADVLDPVERVGWSVVVTGVARAITDPERLERVGELLQPWVDSAMDTAIAISPELITGIRLVPR
ncbi:MAG TPA: pyridoxamine 5'-phosphate oxidase family protein [Marmoricola sp.]|nr:pyridoxamine 5'-phosphate oxidase family protein [Marmoricola sp.]